MPNNFPKICPKNNLESAWICEYNFVYLLCSSVRAILKFKYLNPASFGGRVFRI